MKRRERTLFRRAGERLANLRDNVTQTATISVAAQSSGDKAGMHRVDRDAVICPASRQVATEQHVG